MPSVATSRWSAPPDVLDLFGDILDPPTEPPDDELAALEADWEAWLRELLPGYFTAPFADHHRRFWEWLWSIRRGEQPPPFVAVWNRGGTKSTSAEGATVAVAARRVRRYGLYVCDTQDQADDHVGNIGTMLESDRIGERYPALGRPLVGKFGNPKGWRRNRLRTADGFTIDALGLDSAARGVKLDEYRPDLMVFDDLDADGDSPTVTARKIRDITKKLLPAGTDDCAVLAIQNLVHPESIFARLAGVATERAEFLVDRVLSGPVPAVEGLGYVQRGDRWLITEGTPTWSGMDLEACQAFIDRWGISAFLQEAQHEVEAAPGGMFDHLDYVRRPASAVPWAHMIRVGVWVDPAVTSKDSSDSHGIQADGIDVHGVIWRLFSWEARTSPVDSIKRALRTAVELGADVVGVETDQGRDTWISVVREAIGELAEDPDEPTTAEDLAGISIRSVLASQEQKSKAHRASKMLVDYERPGRVVHVEGTHLVLERALNRFPKTKPLDLVDTAYWSWRHLRGGQSVPLDPDAHRREPARRPLGRQPVVVGAPRDKQIGAPPRRRRRGSTPSW